MTSYHHGWLLLAEDNGNYQELFNHARTAAYLQNSSALGCGTVLDVLDDGGCSAYRWMPPTLSDGAPVGAIENDDGWWVQDYGTGPDDVDEPAPWWNPNIPESGEALGFWVTEWTGLDSGHIKRGIQQHASGGGSLGRTTSTVREMGFEVILLAESEAAMDYLYRWLDATVSSVCATCRTDTILMRRWCPTVVTDTPPVNQAEQEAPLNGVVEMRGVGLTAGLQWGGPPVEQAGCFIRRVNFTMAATDPCMYSFCNDLVIDANLSWTLCFDGAALSTTRADCRPSCSEMNEECRTTFEFTVDTVGASGPRIEVRSNDTAQSIRHRIRVYSNDIGLNRANICGAPLLCEVNLAPLPPYSSILYDIPGRRVMVASNATSGWVNGFAYVESNTIGIPRFAGLGCGDYTVVVEPNDFCLDTEPAATEGYSATSGSLQERMGCA